MDEAVIEGDTDRLIMAMDVLIENAVEHTEVGDRIELSVRREATQVIAAVEDSGSGITAGETSRIFDRFARVDTGRNREVGGFGLGLAIVKSIAQAHHGSVRVRSTVGMGSVFELLLPVSASPPRPRVTVQPTEESQVVKSSVSLN